MNTAILRQQARTAVIEGRNAGLGMDEPVTMKDGSVGVTMRFKGRTRSLRFTEEMSNSGAIDIWVITLGLDSSPSTANRNKPRCYEISMRYSSAALS